MTTSTTSVRPAGEQDLEFVVWAARTAATSHLARCVWDTLLGLPPARVDELVARVATSPDPHWCHLSRFLVAERDGRPVGAVVGFDPATEGSDRLEQAFLVEIAAQAPDEEALLGMLDRAQALQAVRPADLPGAWGVENVAVVAEARGSGVVDALLTEALARGRRHGHREAQILCLVGNDRAERTWRRHGFEPGTTRRDPRFADTFGAEGVTLLHREL